MSGALQAVFQNQRSFSNLPAIGSAYEGGFFAGQISTAGNGVADYNLVIGPVASAQSSLQFKNANTATTGTTSDIDGPTNSANMNDADHAAAQFCEGLTIGGFSDWYMPARNELEICYFNLKPTTTANQAPPGSSSGANPNAVPARASDYTAGTPAQTSAAAFVTSTGAQAFTAGNYWSSTQIFSNYGWIQDFSDGLQGFSSKTNSQSVRAVRRVAV